MTDKPDIWYAKPDDLIGGYVIMRCDMTPGEFSDWVVEQGVKDYKELLRDMGEVAHFMTEEDALRIALLNNKEVLEKMREDHDA